MGPFQILLFVVWAFSAVALTILVLMHSGKGTGVSDMIASSLYNSSSATGVMEQNLDRLTVIMAVVFAVCVVLCMFFFPQEELRRIVAVYRLVLPGAVIRLAGGRGLLSDRGRGCFQSGANGVISGDMLTTAGITVETDRNLLEELGYEVK